MPRLLRIKVFIVFIDHLCKINITIIRNSFQTLNNTDYSQTLAKQTNEKLDNTLQ